MCWQGHVEAYGNYQELQASGVELMQLIKTKDETDERDIFSLHEEVEEDEGEVEEGGIRRESVGEEGTSPLVTTVTNSISHSPYKRKNILYITESESNLALYTTKSNDPHLGDNLRQFPPDSASIYSAPSMLSIHSAVEAESSKYDEVEVRGGGREGGASL